MAMMSIGNALTLGVTSEHTATDWQFALDEQFTIIIDESINDKEHLKKWHSPLPKVDGDGYYSDLDMVYGRVRARYGDHVSPWYVIYKTQQYQKLNYISQYDADF